MWARLYMRSGPDVALALGTDLDDVAMAGTPPIGPNGVLIHVDTDSTVIGRNYPTAMGAVYDVGAFASALTPLVATSDRTRYRQLIFDVKKASPFDAPNFCDDDSMPYRASPDDFPTSRTPPVPCEHSLPISASTCCSRCTT